MNERRRFLTVSGATGALVTVFTALTQQTRTVPGGLARARHPGQRVCRCSNALRQGLRDLGYSRRPESHRRRALGRSFRRTRTETLAAELVAAKPQVIVTLGPTALRRTPCHDIAAGGVRLQRRSRCWPVSPRALRAPGRQPHRHFVSGPGTGRKKNRTVEGHRARRTDGSPSSPMRSIPGTKRRRRASEAAASAMGLDIEYFEVAGARTTRSGTRRTFRNHATKPLSCSPSRASSATVRVSRRGRFRNRIAGSLRLGAVCR